MEWSVNFIKTHYMPCMKFLNGNNKQKQRRLVNSEMGHAVCRLKSLQGTDQEGSFGLLTFPCKS